MSANAFAPSGDSAALAVTSTSTATAIQVKGNNNNATQRMFYNPSSGKDCWIAAGTAASGTGAPVAVVPTNGTPGNGVAIPAGAIMILSYPPNAFFAAICAGSDTTTLYISGGEGV